METLPLSYAALVVQVLGIPGLIFVIWHFDNKRFQQDKELRLREMSEREQSINRVLAQYREDTLAIKRLYESNVSLVKDYEQQCTRLEQIFVEVMGVVSLNTQTFTRLNDSIEHNLFCPMVRKEMNG